MSTSLHISFVKTVAKFGIYFPNCKIQDRKMGNKSLLTMKLIKPASSWMLTNRMWMTFSTTALFQHQITTDTGVAAAAVGGMLLGFPRTFRPDP